MSRVYIDTETCGLHGFMVLLQYAYDDGPVTLHEVWREPVWATIELILKLAEEDVVGFNLTFDWFHLCKAITTFSLVPDLNWIPAEHIREIAELEYRASREGACLKPKRAMDLMLHLRGGPLQSLMDRKDIIVRCIPDCLADKVRDELEHLVHIDGIYFARRKDKDAPRWRVRPSTDKNKAPIPGFSDIVLSFRPSGALKVLAEHLLGWKETKKFADAAKDLPRPKELGWAPYAKIVGFKKGWPGCIKQHIRLWAFDEYAREYAEDDVKITRDLDKYCGQPEAGDIESTLACMVAAQRWHGFKIKTDAVARQRDMLRAQIDNRIPIAPTRALPWLNELMSPMEAVAFGKKTDKMTLKELAKMECAICDGHDPECTECGGTGKHPVSGRAASILEQRTLKKKIEVYDKLYASARFFPSFKVFGTLSGRMAGADKTHPQGVPHVDEIRDMYELADTELGYVLCGGDFDSFEVTLAIADYGDEALERDVRAGKKIHALFAHKMFPDKTLEEIAASKGTEFDMYTIGKQGVFALTYGGNENTLITRHKIQPEVAKRAFEGFFEDYPGIRIARERLAQEFTAMQQDAAGGPIRWRDPSPFVDSMFGYKRYFTLEQKILKTIYDLAEDPPKEWLQLKLKVVRRAHRGPQLAGNAVRSALYGAAFGIQSHMIRAALNHRIQAAGAKVCKTVQCAIWELQPSGYGRWIVQPFNVHDELPCPTLKGYEDAVADKVSGALVQFLPKVTLLRIDWDKHLDSWSKGMTENKARAIKAAYEVNGHDFAAACKTCGIKSAEMIAKSRRICEGTAWQWLFGQ